MDYQNPPLDPLEQRMKLELIMLARESRKECFKAGARPSSCFLSPALWALFWRVLRAEGGADTARPILLCMLATCDHALQGIALYCRSDFDFAEHKL